MLLFNSMANENIFVSYTYAHKNERMRRRPIIKLERVGLFAVYLIDNISFVTQMLYYEAEADLANATYPSWDESAYRHIDVVAADRVFADINDPVVNAETRSVTVTTNGSYFAFYDQVGGSDLCKFSVPP